MNRATTLALTPLSLAYGIGVRVRNRLYRAGLLKSYDVGAPVISVGNLTTGGTGKTPMVAWLAAQLAADGRRLCVLTRGYRRESSGRLLVSNNDRVIADVRAAGDEPFLLAQKLAGKAAVICDKDRVGAARWAIEHLGTQIFILDDAFQHQRIRRTVNILLLDANSPFGNGRLLPAGNLREPKRELARADCIVITRADESKHIDTLLAEIRAMNGKVPVFTSHTKHVTLRSIAGAASALPGSEPLAAFCGIANPNSFFSLLRDKGYEVVHTRAFRDHHDYSQVDIDAFVEVAAGHGAKALVTTEKDAVKLAALRFSMPCKAAPISIEFDRPEEFLSYVKQSLD